MVFCRWLLFNIMEIGFIQFHINTIGNAFRERARKMSDNYVEKVAPKEYWDILKPKYMAGCKVRSPLRDS